MVTKILLVEDNRHKRDRVLAFLHETWPKWEITQAQSFTSGCKSVAAEEFKVVLLDMSLPTYDKTTTESGGRFRTFGGREIARKVLRRGYKAGILFLTQYESFSDKGNSHTLETLSQELQAECGPSYLGLIHYDSSQSAWKEEMSKKLNQFTNEITNS